MNKITIIAVGALKDLSYQALVKQYQTRLAPYALIKIIESQAYSFNDRTSKQAKHQERQGLERLVHRFSKEQIYLLAEGNSDLDSKGFAKLLAKNESSHLVFVIAGALGWEEGFKDSYQSLSLSNLTFPHDLARLILLEQIYRGISINNGKKYHY